MTHITKKEAYDIGRLYNINFKVVPLREFYLGLNIELEHINVIKDDLDVLLRIVIAHLEEDPRYYYFLDIQEKKREKYYKKHVKPRVLL